MCCSSGSPASASTPAIFIEANKREMPVLPAGCNPANQTFGRASNQESGRALVSPRKSVVKSFYHLRGIKDDSAYGNSRRERPPADWAANGGYCARFGVGGFCDRLWEEFGECAGRRSSRHAGAGAYCDLGKNS